MRPSTAVAAILAGIGATLAVALSACGGPSSDDDHDAVRQTVADFYAAFSRADGDGVCALLTDAARRKEASHRPDIDDDLDNIPETRTCPDRVATVARITIVQKGIAPTIAHAVVRKVDVSADQANAYVSVGQAEKVLTLARVDGRWLIQGVPS